MTTARASAWTISRMARHENGGSSIGTYSGEVTVWGAATPNQCRERSRPNCARRVNGASGSGERRDQQVPRALERVRIREVVDDVVRDEHVDACVGVGQLVRVDDARHPRARFRVGEFEASCSDELLAETGAAADLDGERLRPEVALHPDKPFAEAVAQVRAGAPVELGARERYVAGVADEGHQIRPGAGPKASARYPRSRARAPRTTRSRRRAAR